MGPDSCKTTKPMRAFTAILFLFLLHFKLASQEASGFNKRLTCDYPNTKLYKICIDKDTIVGLGTGSVDSTGIEQGIVLMKFDTFGNLLSAKLLQDSLIGPSPLHIRYGSLLKTPDGGYIMNVIPFLFASPVVLKTDRQFNIEFVKAYEEPGTNDFQQCELKAVGNGYLLHGSMKRSNGVSDGFVSKIDENGEPMWFKSFGDFSTSETVVDVHVMNDSVYVVSKVSVVTPVYGYSSLILLAADGETLSEWDSELEPEIGYLRSVIDADENGFLTYGLYVAEILPPNNTLLVKSTISKLDKDFNIEWAKHYGKKVSLVSEVMFYDFEETIDGNFIGVGMDAILQPTTSATSGGWLMKFSPQGDSIWSRQDTSDVMPVHYTNQHKFGGVGVLSSGSIVAGGYVTQAQNSYLWLVKVTNDGCLDTLYCGLVSGAAEAGQGREQQAAQGLWAYPNPASSAVQLVFQQETGEARAACFDAHGRLVKAERLQVTGGQAGMSTAELPNGLYFLRLEVAGRQPIFAKFEIMR